ncbi:hypothetical protein Tco_0666253 [Tanacetum coccineum]
MTVIPKLSTPSIQGLGLSLMGQSQSVKPFILNDAPPPKEAPKPPKEDTKPATKEEAKPAVKEETKPTTKEEEKDDKKDLHGWCSKPVAWRGSTLMCLQPQRVAYPSTFGSRDNKMEHDLRTPVSWLGIHTQVVVAAMARVSHCSHNDISKPHIDSLEGLRRWSFWEGGDDFRVDGLRFHTCLTDILGFLKNLEWWFKQDIDKEEERFEGDEDGGEV